MEWNSRFGAIPVVVAVGLTAGLTLAQEPPRAELRGVVRALDGSAVDGARVEAWLRPGVGALGYGIDDEVETKTDARGRFRLELLDGYSYSVGAHWKAGQGATAFVPVQEGVRAGRLLRLEEAMQTIRGATVRVDYDDEQALFTAGVTARVSLTGSNSRVLFERSVRSGVEESFDLPFYSIEAPIRLDVVSGPRILSTYSTTVRAAPLRLRSTIRPPLSFAVHVQDQDGKPIANATIESNDTYSSSSWSYAGTTNDEGIARVAFVPASNTRWLLRAFAPGFREGLAQRYGNKFYAEGVSLPKLPNPIAIRLAKATPLRGRLLGFDGKPDEGASIALERALQLRVSPNSTRSLGTTRECVRTDASGHFEFAYLGEATNVRLRTVLRPRSLKPMLGKLDGYPIPETNLTLWSNRHRTREQEAATVDLSKWTVRRLRVVLPDRRPARGAALVPVGDATQNVRRALARVPRADRRGRLSWFGTGASGDWLIVVEGWGWKLEPSATFLEDADDEEPLTIQLEAFTRRRVRVLDGQGRPLAGVTCSITGSSWRGSGPEIQCAAQLNPIGLSGTSDEDGFLELWSIDRDQLTHQLSFRKGRLRTRVPVLPDIGNEIWELRLDG